MSSLLSLFQSNVPDAFSETTEEAPVKKVPKNKPRYIKGDYQKLGYNTEKYLPFLQQYGIEIHYRPPSATRSQVGIQVYTPRSVQVANALIKLKKECSVSDITLLVNQGVRCNVAKIFRVMESGGLVTCTKEGKKLKATITQKGITFYTELAKWQKTLCM